MKTTATSSAGDSSTTPTAAAVTVTTETGVCRDHSYTETEASTCESFFVAPHRQTQHARHFCACCFSLFHGDPRPSFVPDSVDYGTFYTCNDLLTNSGLCQCDLTADERARQIVMTDQRSEGEQMQFTRAARPQVTSGHQLCKQCESIYFGSVSIADDVCVPVSVHRKFNDTKHRIGILLIVGGFVTHFGCIAIATRILHQAMAMDDEEDKVTAVSVEAEDEEIPQKKAVEVVDVNESTVVAAKPRRKKSRRRKTKK
eukprot:TRINITY_DN4896_c0_g1_i1.p1 TRINITY_DN4896_c0_g1~~TRINITY_DN4896_c0_g1_i1.p1  ORF type:complete len:257 (+),score=42.14 TRINITY_DN4896_c0_g1_i1:580-1350(+)